MFTFPKSEYSTRDTTRKVSVIGLSDYGCSFALSLISRSCATHLVLVDNNFQTAKGEALDMLDALPFLPDIKLSYSSDLRATAHSDIVVITAGRPLNREVKNRMELIEKNAPIVANAAFWAAKFSPDATIIIGTDPMDVMTFVASNSARHTREDFPSHRVIGIGTGLDVARMRAVIGRYTGIEAREVVANIVGEHGDNMVPLWKHFRIRGIPLEDACPELTTPSARASLREQVRDAGYRIVEAKLEGTSKGIGECLADLTQMLLVGGGNIRTVCTSVTPDDFFGLSETVYMSVPCMIGSDGVEGLFPFEVSQEERCQILETADILVKAQKRASRALDISKYDPGHVHELGWSSYSFGAKTRGMTEQT